MDNFTTGYLNNLTTFLPNEIRNYLQTENWTNFQDDVEKRVSMYYDDWIDELREHIKSRLSHESRLHFFPNNHTTLWPLPIHVNLLQRVTNEISLLYKSQAYRAFENKGEKKPQTEEENLTEEIESGIETSDRFSDIADIQYNAMMQTVNKLTNVCNACIVMITPDLKEEKGLRFDILTPDMYMPIQDPENPQRLIGIIYSIDSADTPGGYTTVRRNRIYFIGDGESEPFWAEETVSLDNLGKKSLEKQPYPYYYDNEPFLPFVTFRNDYPMAGEYINRTQGQGLYQATLEVASLISRYIRTIEDQAIKQLAVAGPGARDFEPSIIRDHLSIIRIPYGSDQVSLQMLDYQVSISDMWKSILDYIESIIAGFGLSIDKFKSSPQSGLSIRLSNQQLINKIEDQRPFFYSGERELANIIRKINNSALPAGEFGKIDDNFEFIMDFGPLPFDPDPLELSDKYILLVNENIISRAEYLQKLDPELTLEEAQEKIDRNMEMNKKNKPGQGLTTGLGLQQQVPPAVEPTQLEIQPKEEEQTNVTTNLQ